MSKMRDTELSTRGTKPAFLNRFFTVNYKNAFEEIKTAEHSGCLRYRAETCKSFE